MTIEERGWNHIATTGPTLGNSDGSKYDRPILQFVLARLHAFASKNSLTYADMFAREPEEHRHGDATVTGASVMPIETTIRSAFFNIAGRPARDGVRLRALRERLQHIDRATLDDALLEMRKSGRANLMNLDNPRDIAVEGDAALEAGGQTFHILWIDP